ncbi:hypothetical protein HKX48_006645 [Thoreauomyces humboldtii]|nr:hypothetical protein HKX48_006645 [Thoreauomyces humboldtii]
MPRAASQTPLRHSATITSGFSENSGGSDEYPMDDLDDPSPHHATQPNWFRKEDIGLFLMQSTIISVCCVTLFLGLYGVVKVSEGTFPFNQSGVAFGIGIAVQIALIAPLELARRISQVWFWKRLMHRGESFRSLITTWSVIYSNSYRGAEDIFRGIGPISALLMLVYLVEVVVLGAIGSLYEAKAVVTLKGLHSIPMYRPYQYTDVTSMTAGTAEVLASQAFFNFARIYDPSWIQEPPVDENGAILFAMLAFNYDAYPGWTERTFNTYTVESPNVPVSTRTSGVVLCRAAVGLGTTSADYQILQKDPSIVVKLTNSVRDPDPPAMYSMDPATNIWGFSMGIFITAVTFIFACDFLTCEVASTKPPYFVNTMGLSKAVTVNGTTSYTCDLDTVTEGLVRLIARILPWYTTTAKNTTGLDASLTEAYTEVWEQLSTHRIYTTLACNAILAIGIACAGTLIFLHLVQTLGRKAWRLDRSAIWTTSSVYLLLQALPSVRSSGILPNIPQSEWRDAGLERLREAAEEVTVKGSIDSRGKMKLKMTGRDGATLGREAGNLRKGEEGRLPRKNVGKGDGGGPSSLLPVSVKIAHLGDDGT